MQHAAELLADHQLLATPLAGTTAVMWRSPQSGLLVAITEAAPHGRKGLWDAMARAAACGPVATNGPTDEAPAAEPAHLAYLARLADPGERNDATGSVAPVVSLAEFAAVKTVRRLSA
jgi:hypothetical protein